MKRCAARFAGHDDERETRPWHQPVEPPPDPNGFVEDLQHQLIDIPGTEQPAVRPPGRRTDLVETVRGFHREAMGFEQLARVPRAVAAFVSKLRSRVPNKRGPQGTSTTSTPLGFRVARRERSTRPGSSRYSSIFKQSTVSKRSSRPARSAGISGSMRSTATFGVPQEAVAQSVEMKRIFLRGHVAHAPRHEPSGNVPDSGAHLEDSSPMCGRSFRASQLRYWGVPVRLLRTPRPYGAA